MKTRTKEFSDVCNVIRDRFLADGRSEPIRVELQYEKCMIRPEANVFVLTSNIVTITNYFSITHLFTMDVYCIISFLFFFSIDLIEKGMSISRFSFRM